MLCNVDIMRKAEQIDTTLPGVFGTKTPGIGLDWYSTIDGKIEHLLGADEAATALFKYRREEQRTQGVGSCPQGGYAMLHDSEHRHVVETQCKSWRCNHCSIQKKKLYALRIGYGVSKLGPCVAITCTYRMGEGLRRDAEFVLRSHRLLWQRLKEGRWKNVEWAKVTELTKVGQAHTHMVAGPIDFPDRCRKRQYSEKRLRSKGVYPMWRAETCTARWMGKREECAQHEMSRVWEDITGDSYVVYVGKLKRTSGYSTYMAKYMGKSLSERNTLEGMGFKRAFTTSRGFPRPEQMRLAGSQIGSGKYIKRPSEWEKIGLYPKDKREMEDWQVDLDLPLMAREETYSCQNMQREGDDLGAEARRAIKIRKIEKVIRTGEAQWLR